MQKLLLVKDIHTPVTNTRSLEAVMEMLVDASHKTKIRLMTATTNYGQNVLHLTALAGANDRWMVMVDENYTALVEMQDLMMPDVCGNTPLDYMIIGQHTDMLLSALKLINNPITVQRLLASKNNCGFPSSSLARCNPRDLIPGLSSTKM